MEKDEKGNIILTEAELEATMSKVAKAAVDGFAKENKLDEVVQKVLHPVITQIVNPIDAMKPHERFFAWAGSKLDTSWTRDKYGSEVLKTLLGNSGEGDKLVPQGYGTDVMMKVEQYSASQFCTPYPMDTDSITLRAWNADPEVYFVAQQTAATEALPTFTNPTLTAQALVGKVVLAKEFFRDNNVGAYNALQQKLAERVAYKFDLEIFVGSAFTGIFGSATPQTTTTTSTDIKDLTNADINDCMNSISVGARGLNPKWYMHRTMWAKILSMKDDQNRPLFDTVDGLAPRLKGYQVYLSEAITAYAITANTAYIAFGDLQWEVYGTRDPVEVKLLDQASIVIAGPTTVNLADQRSVALFMDTRVAFVTAVPGNLAIIKSHA